MIAAFKAHQERQPTLNLPIEPQTRSVVPETHRLQREDFTPTRSIQAGEAADTSTPLLTFEGDTPADLGAVLTPEPHEIVQPLIARNEIRRLSMEAPAIKSTANMAQHPTKSTTSKRRAPSGFDGITDSEKITKRHSAARVAQKPLLSNTFTYPSNFMPDGSARADVLADLEPVQEEPLSPGRTIDDVEADMGVPHGFIHWVKNDLARSRWSVQSVISAIGTAASRISSRRSSQQPAFESTMPEELGSLFYSQTSRAVFHLFGKLRLTAVTDNEVAEQVRQLLQEYSRDEAQYIVRARNERQETALEVALALGNVPACEVLLKFGADVNATTSSGKSLSAFGRAAEKTATTSQLVVAIGICRNRIRSHTGHRETQTKPEARKAKRKSNVSTSASRRARSRAQVTTSYPQKANTSSDVNYDQPHQCARPVVSQNSNGSDSQPASSQLVPAPGFSDPTSSWIPDHQLVHDSQMTNTTQGYLLDTQILNSEVVPDGGTIVPALPAFDSSTGYWALVEGNRRAFVFYNHIDLPPSTHAPILSHGPSQIPAPEPLAVPTAQIDLEQPFQWHSRRNDPRRHGMILGPSTTVPNTIITPTNPVSRRLQQPETIASTIPAFSNLYDTQSYNSQANILCEAQPAFQYAFQQGLSNDNDAFRNVLATQLDPPFFQETLNNTDIPLMWDGI